MKQKLQQTSKKYFIVPIAAIGIIAILAFSVADKVNAHSFKEASGALAQEIAQKFNLEQEEVAQVMQEFHEKEAETREQELRARIETKLETAVSEQKLTDAQRYAVLEKYEEMHDRMMELNDQDLSPEDIHELRYDIHEEMLAWAEERGIDFEVFMKAGKRMMHGGGRYLL